MLFERIVCIALSFSNSEDQQYKQFFPKVSNLEIQKVLDDPKTIVYDLPQAAQSAPDDALVGIHSPSYNLSANPTEPFGGPNKELPWKLPFGIHDGDGTLSFRFINLQDKPVVYFPNRRLTGYSWIFPTGTVIGEVLLIKDNEKGYHTFEMRIRKKGIGKWHMDVFRPAPTIRDLAYLTNDTKIENIPLSGPFFGLKTKHPNKTVFNQTRKMDFLPNFEPQTVSRILDTTIFQSSVNKIWKYEEYAPHAPTSDIAYNLVPKGYFGGLVEVNDKSCMQCHESVRQSVSVFDRGRDWYTTVRGSDGIFSFHPFARESISYSGFGHPTRFNQEMLSKGIIAPFNPFVHTSDYYQWVLE